MIRINYEAQDKALSLESLLCVSGHPASIPPAIGLGKASGDMALWAYLIETSLTSRTSSS